MLRIVILFLVSSFFIGSYAFAWEWTDKSTKEKDVPDTSTSTRSDYNPGDRVKPITAEELQKTGNPTQTQTKSLNDSDVKDNILGIEEWKLRKWDVDMNTIPLVIVNIISVLLWVAGTVAVFSLIYHAVQMQINSGITGDSSWVDKAKKWMIGSLIWFVIAISAWFLVTRAIDLLSAIS